MAEDTLAIIKPDGVARNLIGEIISRIEARGLRIKAIKMALLSKMQAEGFYAVHRERGFFDSLTSYMSEGPVVLMILSGENAIQTWRELMGATDPAKAAAATIRSEFGQSIERNTTHGSDAPETAAFETAYFFDRLETCG
ncbi:MAG: nucleoside-diphosphate kinase [Deltaproteobacteria bacterium]|nr:nucleoside-diphosphate kinase [Deltaproteobacteria bacterium]